ncbi:lantibiotic dehydratase [Streptomyces sp. A5-4]|uniref:lantibiotic dehydratase n=1 Tax=Streptomyces sp. A5-4 TaxID=3384771 RepID=UPI003DA8024C
MKAAERTPYYRPVDAAMLRASVHRADMLLPPWPGVNTEGGQWSGWLAQVWTDGTVAEAVALASPVLAEQIEAMLTGRPTAVAQARRMAMALARYLLRMRGRATPFGTFAGVSAAHFAPHPTPRWSERHRTRTRTRADAVWVAEITARLEACPALLRRLPVVMNDLAVERGDRLIVPWQPHTGAPSRGPQDEVSVRLIPVVRTIRHTALSPVRVSDLIDKVVAEHPGAAHPALEAMIGELVARGVLISSLRAPSTVTEALAHLLDRLHGTDTSHLPEVQPLVHELHTIHAQLHRVDDAGSPVGGWGRREAARRMRALCAAVEQPLTVDLRLGGALVLPQQVAAEAAVAAQALIRLSPVPSTSRSWREYHGSFVGRYGTGTLVPVTELANPVTGLGFPRHFSKPHPEVMETSPRDEALLALAQQAALDGADEVVLDQKALDTLTAGNRDARRPVSAVDLWVDVRAASPAALAEGAFSLGVCGFGRIAANTGRFLDLLEEADRQRMTGLYAALPPGVHGALAAQLSFPPRHPRIENVLRVPPVLPDVIPLAEHREPADGHIPVADLAVTADSTRLYVVSRTRGRVVEPMLPHAGARHTMPPLARLLFEIPRSVHPAVTSFDWGTAGCLPFLPRVRYGRSILAPAQWRLDPADLPGPDVPMPAWSSALETVREQRRLPAGIAVGAGDRRMRLDLDESMDRSVLRAHLETATGPVTLAEAPTAADHGWLDGRAHEIVIPLAATAPPEPAPVFLTGSAPLPITGQDHGAGVVFVQLYGHPDVFDTILTTHVPTLLQRWQTPPQWWFARYRHPAPHLRLRLHDPDGERAAGRMAAWAAGLRQHGLAGKITFDAYRPETGRYGTGPAMEAAEELFAADSAAVVAQLRCLSASREIHPQALTAASLVDLAGAVSGGRAAGMRWLTGHPDLAAGAPGQDRDVRRQTLRLADSGLLGLAGGAAVAAAWAARATAASRYTARLTPETTRVTPESVLGSLLHMHHVRAHGIDPQAEAMAHKLARSVALAHAARTADDEGGGR